MNFIFFVFGIAEIVHDEVRVRVRLTKQKLEFSPVPHLPNIRISTFGPVVSRPFWTILGSYVPHRVRR